MFCPASDENRFDWKSSRFILREQRTRTRAKAWLLSSFYPLVSPCFQLSAALFQRGRERRSCDAELPPLPRVESASTQPSTLSNFPARSGGRYFFAFSELSRPGDWLSDHPRIFPLFSYPRVRRCPQFSFLLPSRKLLPSFVFAKSPPREEFLAPGKYIPGDTAAARICNLSEVESVDISFRRGWIRSLFNLLTKCPFFSFFFALI